MLDQTVYGALVVSQVAASVEPGPASCTMKRPLPVFAHVRADVGRLGRHVAAEPAEKLPTRRHVEVLAAPYSSHVFPRNDGLGGHAKTNREIKKKGRNKPKPS